MPHDVDSTLASHVHSLLPGDGWSLSTLSRDRDIVLRASRGGAPEEDLVVRLRPTSRMPDETARALVAYLRSLGEDVELRVPRPTRLADGRWFGTVDLEGCPHLASIVAWVSGVRAPDAEAFVEEARLRLVGAAVARMHERARGVPRQLACAVPRLDSASLLGEGSVLERDALRRDLPRGLLDDIVRARASMAIALDGQSAESGLVHADLEPQNWVFDDGRPGVIDFAEFRHAPFALDLAGVLWTHALWKDYRRYRAWLFQGYETVRPLPQGLRESADVFAAASFVVWLRFVFEEIREADRAPFRKHVRPAVEAIVRLCEGCA